MPSIARVLNAEIQRLARREAEALIAPLAARLRNLEQTVREQRQQIAALQKGLKKKPNKKSVEPSIGDVPSEEQVRSTTKSMRTHRERLGLSQKELGALLGVSPLTIWNWETGKTVPRGKNRLAVAELRKWEKRAVQEKLAEKDKV